MNIITCSSGVRIPVGAPPARMLKYLFCASSPVRSGSLAGRLRISYHRSIEGEINAAKAVMPHESRAGAFSVPN